jgi:hypothetical protein
VGDARAHDIGKGLSLGIDVVHVATRPGKKPETLHPADGLAEPKLAHEDLLATRGIGRQGRNSNQMT